MTIGPKLAHQAFALDNDVLNDWRAGKPATQQAIKDYIAVTKAPPALTSTTVFEMMHGFEKSSFISKGTNLRTEVDKENARELARNALVLPFDERAAEIAAYVYPRLSQAERNKHWTDLLIAATALAHDYGVITRNREDFELIARFIPPSYSVLRLQIWK
jgi:tRNA(fMet)-specific endonuclease VapC